MASRVQQTLDAWRERGDDRLDPVRFRFIEALHRRAAGWDGETRRFLDARLSGLLDAYADDLRRAADAGDLGDSADSGDRAALAREPIRGPLGKLVDDIERRAAADGDGSAHDRGARGHRSYPELEMLEYFKEVWSKVSTERQLRQSLDQVPKNAGPLNSSSLVHRSLSLMLDLSPEYLRRFLSYVDALSWLEQMNGGAQTASDAPRAANARKGARTKPR